MTYVICEPCIDVKDHACAEICPVECIHPMRNDPENPDKFDEEEQFYIDPEECIDCAICEPACPVEAIFVEEEVPEEWEHFIQINADYFQE